MSGTYQSRLKIIIAGSRHISDVSLIEPAVIAALREKGPYLDYLAVDLFGWPCAVAEVVSGGANGVDLLGEQWAESRGIPVKRFPADWRKYGRRAGPLRNREMAEYVGPRESLLVALWDGESRGTADMVKTAEAVGVTTFVQWVAP